MQNANAVSDPVIFDDDFIEYQRALRAETLEREWLLYFATQFPGTPVGVRAELMLKLPLATQVTFTMDKPLFATVRIELPAWTLVLLGLVHLVVWRIARRVLRTAAPAFVATRIRVGVRPMTRTAAIAGAGARSTTRVI